MLKICFEIAFSVVICPLILHGLRNRDYEEFLNKATQRYKAGQRSIETNSHPLLIRKTIYLLEKLR